MSVRPEKVVFEPQKARRTVPGRLFFFRRVGVES